MTNDNTSLGTVTAYFKLIAKSEDERNFLNQRKDQLKKQEKLVKDSNTKSSKEVTKQWDKAYDKIGTSGKKAFGFLKSFSKAGNLGLLSLALGMGGAGIFGTLMGLKGFAKGRIDTAKQVGEEAMYKTRGFNATSSALNTTSERAAIMSTYADRRGIGSDFITSSANKLTGMRRKDSQLNDRFNSGDQLQDLLNFLNTVGGKGANAQNQILQENFGKGSVAPLQKIIQDMKSGFLGDVFSGSKSTGNLNSIVPNLSAQSDILDKDRIIRDIRELSSINEKALEIRQKINSNEERALVVLQQTIAAYEALNAISKLLTGTFNAFNDASVGALGTIYGSFPSQSGASSGVQKTIAKYPSLQTAGKMHPAIYALYPELKLSENNQ